MRTNYNHLAGQLENKLRSGSQITQDDIDQAAKVAKATGRPQDRVLYAQIKRARQRMAISADGGTE